MYDFCTQIWVYVVVLMSIDILTGTLVAYLNGFIDPEDAFKGGLKRFGVLFALAKIAEDTAKVPVYHASCIFYLVYEAESVIENLNLLGLPLPKGLKEAFISLKDISESNSKN
jgi:toxin secretion/phage lysis holin